METLSTSKANNYWLDSLAINGQTPMQILHKRLTTIYGKKWKENFKSNEDLIEWSVGWSLAFEEMRITPDMIKRGLKNCLLLYDYPPTLPQFIKACLTKDRDECYQQNSIIRHEVKASEKEHAIERIKALKQQFKNKVNKPNIPTEHQWIFDILEKHQSNSKKISFSALRNAYQAANYFGYKF